MNRCKRCQVEIKDDVEICPLCNSVLTKDNNNEQMDAYPDIGHKIKIMKQIILVFSYLIVVLEIVFCLLDYYLDKKMSWSLITGVCFLYAIFTLFYSFNRRNGHIRKIFVQAAAAIVLLLFIDILTGKNGWSLCYGMPCAVLLLDAILVICMLVNLKDWQSYLLVQLFTLLISVLLLILYFCNVIVSPVLPWVSFGTSAIIFSFCLCIGNRKAKNELKRRFYI